MSPIIVNLTPYYGLIHISGPDAATFLQGQLTCDIHEVNETELKLSAFCNLKGRVRALFKLYKKNDSFYLQLPKSLLDTIINQFKKYGMFSKITVVDESALWAIFGIANLDIHTANTDTQLTITKGTPNFKETFFNDSILNDASLLKIQNSEHHFELIITHEKAADCWKTLSGKANTRDFNDWKLLDIRLGYPEVWLESSEQFLPHHLNLPALGAVSFNKGCYCGQEIIARMHYLGKIKRQMTYKRLENFNTLPLPGTLLSNEAGKELGIVITAATANNGALELLIESTSSIQ